MSSVDAYRVRTVDLQDRLDEINEMLEDLQGSREDLVDEVMDEYGDYASTPQSYKETYRKFEERIQELENEKDMFEDQIEDWGSTEFEIKRFTGGEIAAMEDEAASEVASSMQDEDSSMPQIGDGFARSMLVEKGCVSTPADCPEHLPDLLNPVFSYLFEQIDEWNGGGRVEMGKSSLREAMDARGDDG